MFESNNQRTETDSVGFVEMKRWWIEGGNGHSSYRVAACICHFLSNPTGPPPPTECHAHSYVNGACISFKVLFCCFYASQNPTRLTLCECLTPGVQLCGRWEAGSMAGWSCGRRLVSGRILANIPLLWPAGQ